MIFRLNFHVPSIHIHSKTLIFTIYIHHTSDLPIRLMTHQISD